MDIVLTYYSDFRIFDEVYDDEPCVVWAYLWLSAAYGKQLFKLI